MTDDILDEIPERAKTLKVILANVCTSDYVGNALDFQIVVAAKFFSEATIAKAWAMGYWTIATSGDRYVLSTGEAVN